VIGYDARLHDQAPHKKLYQRYVDKRPQKPLRPHHQLHQIELKTTASNTTSLPSASEFYPPYNQTDPEISNILTSRSIPSPAY
jgi:hypothetical protein